MSLFQQPNIGGYSLTEITTNVEMFNGLSLDRSKQAFQDCIGDEFPYDVVDSVQKYATKLSQKLNSSLDDVLCGAAVTDTNQEFNDIIDSVSNAYDKFGTDPIFSSKTEEDLYKINGLGTDKIISSNAWIKSWSKSDFAKPITTGSFINELKTGDILADNVSITVKPSISIVNKTLNTGSISVNINITNLRRGPNDGSSKTKDGTNILVDIYSKAHVGGKFSNKGYGGNVSGLNGIGGSCVCLSSLSFEVKSFRDKAMAEAKFSKGVNTYYKESKTTEANGTYVYFIPDKEVFKNGNIGFTYSRVCQEIKDISFLYKNLTFVITNENTKEKKEFCAKNGIIDFVKEEVKKPLHQHIIAWRETDGQNEIEIAFQWGEKRETVYTFVNGLRCPEHGVNLTGAKSAITKTFNNLSGENFESDNIRHNLFYVMNFKIANPSFANQTKSKINSPCARTLASKAFTNALKEMKTKYGSEFEAISVLLKRVEKADAAAEKARNAILESVNNVEKNQKRKVFSSDKLKDAEYLGEKSTLLIVEGDSAASAVAQARDRKHFGLLAIRGKILNCLSNPEEAIFKNEEINLLLSAMNIVPNKGPIEPIEANTSCNVMNRSEGPAKAASLPPKAKAAGRIARPAIRATVVSEITTISEFLTMF